MKWQNTSKALSICLPLLFFTCGKKEEPSIYTLRGEGSRYEQYQEAHGIDPYLRPRKQKSWFDKLME